MRILVLAKAPLPGRSKTRLQQRWTPHQAAALAEAALVDTLDAVAGVEAQHELVLDGLTGPWLPAGFDVRPQVDGSHGERIVAALAAHDEPCLLIGMDTPQVTAQQLKRGLDFLRHKDAALGHADDGGWWCLALRTPRRHAGLVVDIATSTPTTGADTEAALRLAGLSVALLPQLRDVDLPSDALHVACLAPHSRFAQALRSCERAA